jgi:anaphase-promoting complex subunit 3
MPKRLRSTSRQPEALRSSKPTKSTSDEPPKKARPALTFINYLSSGRPSQPATSSKTLGVAAKSNSQSVNPNLPPRRSTRLLSGLGSKPAHSKVIVFRFGQIYGKIDTPCIFLLSGPSVSLQHPPTRDRRRQVGPGRSRSIEPEMDEDAFGADIVFSSSPPSIPHSPRSEEFPAQWTPAHEQAAQEAYEAELAENYLYNLTRRFASATRALAMYDSRACLDELEQLPHVHQQSPWVLAMVGRAHYERLEYASVRVPNTRSFT